MNVISWSAIDLECGNYKDGFVAVFRKYESMPTDQKDASGRTIKVTVTSFTRHFGLDANAFRRWVRDGAAAPRPPHVQERQIRDTARSVVRRRPDAVVDAIMEAPTSRQDEIYHELKLRRAGVDTSEANRKASVAKAHQQVEPIRRALASTELPLCIGALQEAKEHLQNMITQGALDDDAMAKITAAHEAFAFTLAEARFSVS
jgi:hypothetical protein